MEAAASELAMGAWLSKDSQEFFHGLLDEVRLWSRALSDAEIDRNMHRTLAMPVEGLIFYWRFDRSYCDEVNFFLGGKTSFSPPEEEMSLVARVPSGADVEMMSVSWACLAECPPHPALAHGTVSPSGTTHEGDRLELRCNPNYELRCADGAEACASVTCQNDGENKGIFAPEVAASCVGVCGR